MAKKSKKKELKEKLYKLIDSIEDEQVLQTLNEEMAPYAIDRVQGPEADELTAEQLRELDKADKEIERGETISWEALKKEMAAWR